MKKTREVNRIFYIFKRCPECGIQMEINMRGMIQVVRQNNSYECPDCGCIEMSTNHYPQLTVTCKDEIKETT